LIYGLAGFLIFFGLLRQDFLSLFISLAIAFFYGGGLFYGMLPTDSRVSWEAHVFGALTGIITAFNLANKKRVT
jgi:membrane associated rhomboid family serine protease